jgi:hypothetical protein
VKGVDNLFEKATKDLVFWEPDGGLGDALAYSTLPELSTSQKRASFYLSSYYKPRNPGILDFVWGQNPFVAGWANGPAGLGARRKYIATPGGNFISDMERANGFHPENSRPKYYYRPSHNSEVSGKTLVDLSSVTVARGPFLPTTDSLENALLSLEQELIFILPSQLYSSVGEFFPSRLVRENVREVDSLFDYADLLASARRFVGLQSGALSLAVATLQYNPTLELTGLMHPKLMKSDLISQDRVHIYPDVEYVSLE